MNKAIMIMLAALAAFAGFSETVENVRTDSAGNVYARFGSLGRNSFVATNVVEGLPLSGGDMAGPLNMGFNPITFNGSTNSSEWALWDMLRAWPTGAEGPVLLPFVITNAIAGEVDGILNGTKPFTAFNVRLPLGAGMTDPLQNFWVNGTNLHDWVQLLAPVPDLSAELGAFARTGEVFRAANWGTRDRWVDATGVVWRASSDPYLDYWVIEPADQAQGMYVRWDGDSWIWGMEGAEYDTAYDVDTGTISVNFGTGVSYKATRHPGGPAEAVDRVMLVSMSPGDYAAASNNAMRAMEFSFAASNNVPIASAFGTPDRWTDATGCVWQASSDNDAFWEFFPTLAPDVEILSITYSDPDWRVDIYDGSDIRGAYAGSASSTMLEFDFYEYGKVRAIRKKLVGRLALMSDLESATPGNYATVSNRAMRAVQQVGSKVDIGSDGYISWGQYSDRTLNAGDTGWSFVWDDYGSIRIPITNGDHVVALRADLPNVPSWAMANAKPTYTAAEVGAIAKTGGVYSVTRYLHVSPRLSVGTFTASVPPFDMSGGGTGNAFVFGDNIQTKAPDTVTLGVGTLNTNNYSFVWSGDANRYYMPTLPSMSNPYSTKYNGGFHVNPSVRSGMSGPLENFWIGEKNLDTWIGEKSVTPQTVTNVVRRIVSVTSDYVWDAQAECLYRRSMENQFLYWTPVTNVNALLPENAHILEYLEEHKND